MIDDQKQVELYLDHAQMFAGRGNEFGHGLWLGRALEYADQNAIDPEWLIDAMDSRGLDSALVAVPKMDVGRG